MYSIGLGMPNQYEHERRSARVREDTFQRRRFFDHNRAMTLAGQGARYGEREVAYERSGKDWTKADKMEWSNYVTNGGNRPSGGSSGGGGAPVMGAAPELNLPEYDEDKVSSLTQKRAAPAIRKLRETTQRATSANYDNPNVKKMTVREALAGYGTGLEGVVAGAGRAASIEYGDQYAASVNAEMAKYRSAVNRQSREFEVQSRDWLMGRENEYWKERQDYEDPYTAFDAFYG